MSRENRLCGAPRIHGELLKLGTFWPLAPRERSDIKRLLKQEDVRKLATILRTRKDDAHVKMLDSAYWVKSCSSLGRLRFAAILHVGKNFKSDLCLMDTSPYWPINLATILPPEHRGGPIEGMRSCAVLCRDVFSERGSDYGFDSFDKGAPRIDGPGFIESYTRILKLTWVHLSVPSISANG